MFCFVNGVSQKQKSECLGQLSSTMNHNSIGLWCFAKGYPLPVICAKLQHAKLSECTAIYIHEVVVEMLYSKAGNLFWVMITFYYSEQRLLLICKSEESRLTLNDKSKESGLYLNTVVGQQSRFLWTMSLHFDITPLLNSEKI